MKTTAGKRRRKTGRTWAFGLFLIGAGLVVLGLAAWLLLPKPDAPAGETSGRLPAVVHFPAPELELTGLDGQPVALVDYLGQVVLVNNWATWCPPCKAEMPDLQAYYADHREQGFTIIAIEAGDPVPEVTAFIEEYGLTFPVWPDAQNLSLSAFRNQSLPSSYVIDRDGTVLLAWTGAVSREALEKYVTPLLED